MAAETLSAAAREAALSHLRHVLRFGGLVRVNEPGRDYLLSILTPELIALGEAAVEYERRKSDTDAAWEPSDLQSAYAFERHAEQKFTEAARAYAASALQSVEDKR